MSNVIDSEVWSFFCKMLPRNESEIQKQKQQYAEIEWAAQIEEMRTKLVRSTVSKNDENQVVLRIPLMTQIFELKIQKSENFPDEGPEFRGDFIDGFMSFEWISSSTLYELAEAITDHCVSVDMAILEIKEAESDGFHIVELEIDEEEPGHLMVQLGAVKYNEKLSMSLDIADFRSFPRVLRCSNPERTTSFDCEKWISDDKLGSNLRRLYGELEAQDEFAHFDKAVQSKENDSFEDDRDLMDFI